MEARGHKRPESLPEAGIEPSIGSVGDSHGSAFVESVISLYKRNVSNSETATTRAERDSARRSAVEQVLSAYGLMKNTGDVFHNFEVVERTKLYRCVSNPSSGPSG